MEINTLTLLLLYNSGSQSHSLTPLKETITISFGLGMLTQDI